MFDENKSVKETSLGRGETPKEVSISPFSVGDEPTKDDTLGFEPYVEAIAKFLTDPSTQHPLTLSIEGEWGSGKSSFMKQLQEKLRKKEKLSKKKVHIVEFNAWKHDKEDSLWAAFALNFIKYISSELSLSRRWIGHVRLLYKRFSWEKGLFEIIRFLAIWLFIISMAVAFLYLYLKGIYSLDNLQEAQLQDIFKKFINISGVGGSIGIVILLWTKLKNYASSSFEINLNKYVQSPDYENRISFIEEFHDDFKKIVDAYTGKDMVYIFIDDIDRCDVTKAADLMQAINLMIQPHPCLNFIIGMDREKVAASITVKHEKLLSYLSSSKNGNLEKPLDFGYTFIEKFIQLPFMVPRPTERDLEGFFGKLYSTPKEKKRQFGQPIIELIKKYKKYIYLEKTDSKPSETIPDTKEILEEVKQKRETIILKVTGVSQEVRDIALLIAPALENNPRHLKQFLNLFQLKAFIASETGLFDYSEDSPEYLKLGQLGKFVAISLKWPLLIEDLKADPSLFKVLQELSIESQGLLFSWKPDSEDDNKKFMSFLKDDLDINWVENAEIIKTDGDKTIRIIDKEKSVEIELDDEKKNAALKVSGRRIYNLQVKEENGKLNIYRNLSDAAKYWSKHEELRDILRATCRNKKKEERCSISKGIVIKLLQVSPRVIRSKSSFPLENFPEDLYYTEDNTWARIENDGIVTVGINSYFMKSVGITEFIDLPMEDDEFERGEAFGSLESSLWVGGLIMPVSGTIIGVNESIEDNLSLLSEDPYGEGWLIKVKPSSLKDDLKMLIHGDDVGPRLKKEIHESKKK